MARITITSLAIENFGPFRERQVIDLDVSSSRPIVLLKALNGSGKTTLLGALQVCLYGYRAMHSGRRTHFDQYVASLQRQDATGPSVLDTLLSVEFGGTTRAMRVVREFSTKGAGIQEKLVVFVDGTQDIDATATWDEFIEGILPAELLQLFFFDGEKIESLANPDRLPDLLRRATEVFLGIGGIDAAVADLRAAERRILLRNKDQGDDFAVAKTALADLESQADELRNQLTIATQQRGQAQNELDLAHTSLTKYVDKSKRGGLMSFEVAAALKAKVNEATHTVSAARTALADSLSDPFAPMAWIPKLWSMYSTSWKREQDSHLRASVLKEVREHDHRVLAEVQNQLTANAMQVLRLAMKSDAERAGGKPGRRVYMHGAEPNEVVPRIEFSIQSTREKLHQVDAARRSLNSAEQQIKALPAEDELARLVGGLAEHTKRVAEAESALATAAVRIGECQSHLGHLEMKINAARGRLSSDFRERMMEAKGLEAAARAKQVLTAFKEKLLASKAAWLSDMISTEFRRLMRKKRLVTRVEVDPESYRVSIRAGGSHELPMDRLSAGERQLLAISILSALIKERKGRFPVVVDTPLARLDGEHRQSLVTHFFSTVSHQVLVLSTDEEVAGETYDTLRPAMSKEYELQFDESIAATKIVNSKVGLRRVA